jgi:hypothetical protein
MQINDQQQPSQAQNLLLILRFQIALRTLANRRVMPTLIWTLHYLLFITL